MNYREFTYEEIQLARTNEFKMNEIIESYSGVADYFAMLYFKPNRANDKDDLYNNGLLGIYKAVTNFDPTKGAKFSTHCFINIKGAIQQLARQTKNSSQGTGLARKEKINSENMTISIYEKVSSKPNTLIVDEIVDETINIETDYLASEFERCFWDDIKSQLTPKQFEAIYSTYKLGYSQIDLAEIKGVKRQAINNLVMQSLKMLRKRLDENKYL